MSAIVVYDPTSTDNPSGLLTITHAFGPYHLLPIDLAWYRDEILATDETSDPASWYGGSIKFELNSSGGSVSILHDAVPRAGVPVWGALTEGIDGLQDLGANGYFPAATVFHQEYGFNASSPATIVAPSHNYRLYDFEFFTPSHLYSGTGTYSVELSTSEILAGGWALYVVQGACVSVGVYT